MIVGLFKEAVQSVLRQYGRRIERIRDPFIDMQRLLAPFAVSSVVDGGAYHGLVARKLLSTFPGATVWAFEPHNESFPVLQDNVKPVPNIRPINLALSSSSGTKNLHTTEAAHSSSLTLTSTLGEKYWSETMRPRGIQPVEAVTLDEWALNAGVSCVDVIKLDLQGHELEALEGATGLLRSTVKLIYTEVQFAQEYENACLLSQVETFLQQQGFHLYYLYNLSTGKDGRLLEADVIFTEEEFMANSLLRHGNAGIRR